MAKLLIEYARFGIRENRMAVEPDACDACWRLRDRTYEVASAPPIPVVGCRRDACRCDYDPLTRG